MVSFLKKLTSSDVSVSGGGGLPPQTVRVAILGDSGVGKSSLIDLLVTGQAVSKAPRSTAGCTVNVVLWDVDAGGGDGSDAAGGGARSLAAAAAALGGGGGGTRHEGGRGGGGSGQKFFVELWDVSAAPYYEQVRVLADLI
jgi:GTPase SAR1 family protein